MSAKTQIKDRISLPVRDGLGQLSVGTRQSLVVLDDRGLLGVNETDDAVRQRGSRIAGISKLMGLLGARHRHCGQAKVGIEVM